MSKILSRCEHFFPLPTSNFRLTSALTIVWTRLFYVFVDLLPFTIILLNVDKLQCHPWSDPPRFKNSRGGRHSICPLRLATARGHNIRHRFSGLRWNNNRTLSAFNPGTHQWRAIPIRSIRSWASARNKKKKTHTKKRNYKGQRSVRLVFAYDNNNVII